LSHTNLICVPEMKAIIISGMPAAGKTTVAKIISKRLNIPTIGGGEILKEMAVEKGYKPGGNNWWDTAEGMKFLKEREMDPEFDKEADRRMAEKINKGNIVVTSYTQPWIIKDGLKVWLGASQEKRAHRMSVRDHTDKTESTKAVKIRDKENHSLYMKMYNIDLGNDTKPFDLIIDTNDKTPDEIASIIIDEASKKK
jgi:CMP/dCMP kinase